MSFFLISVEIRLWVPKLFRKHTCLCIECNRTTFDSRANYGRKTAVFFITDISEKLEYIFHNSGCLHGENCCLKISALTSLD